MTAWRASPVAAAHPRCTPARRDQVALVLTVGPDAGAVVAGSVVAGPFEDGLDEVQAPAASESTTRVASRDPPTIGAWAR